MKMLNMVRRFVQSHTAGSGCNRIHKLGFSEKGVWRYRVLFSSSWLPWASWVVLQLETLLIRVTASNSWVCPQLPWRLEWKMKWKGLQTQPAYPLHFTSESIGEHQRGHGFNPDHPVGQSSKQEQTWGSGSGWCEWSQLLLSISCLCLFFLHILGRASCYLQNICPVYPLSLGEQSPC